MVAMLAPENDVLIVRKRGQTYLWSYSPSDVQALYRLLFECADDPTNPMTLADVCYAQCCVRLRLRQLSEART